MIKTIDIIRSEIEQLQIRELEMKGVLNRDLYLTGLSNDSLTVMHLYWKGRNVNTLTEFINTAISNGVPKVIIMNKYEDWNVTAYIE